MRLPALEQCREQAAEVRVDLLVGVEQAYTTLAVEVSDRTAQAVDRLGQLVGFFSTLRARAVQFGKLGFRNQVDRADPLALRGQTFEVRGLLVGVARFVGIETKLLRESLGNTFELTHASPRENRAARLLGLVPGSSGGAALARIGRALIRLSDCLRRFD